MSESQHENGKIALITGGGQGIGYAIAKELALSGAHVVVADIDATKAASAATSIAECSELNATGIEIDVSDEDSVRRGIDWIKAEIGAPGILVNNAGVYRSTPILKVDLATWHKLLDVMLTGPLLLSQAVLPGMIDANWGRIINLGSLASVMGYGEDVAYCVAKSGIQGMTRSLAAELAKHRICVNTICPGNVLTDLMKEAGRAIEERDGLERGQFLRERAADIPLGRLGEPEDIAPFVTFLCGEKGEYITGQTFHINGGMYQT